MSPSTYLYCVTDALHDPPEAVTGLHGAAIRAVTANGLSCVVSDTGGRTPVLDRESALAHERVLEAIMREQPIIPLAFGHVVASEAEIAAQLLAAHEQELREQLDALRGKIELACKALWRDLAPVFARIAEEHEEIRRLKAKRSVARDEQIRAGEIAAHALEAMRSAIEDDLLASLRDAAVSWKRCKIFGDQMITNLAFLVGAGDLERFDALVNACGVRMGDNVTLRYTGPVPPYNFVDTKISLQMQDAAI